MIALTIEVTNAQKQNIEISVENARPQKVNVEQDVIIVPVYKDATLYEGEYDITPKVEAQTLRTAQKILEQDVNISAIPYAEVQNNANGKTVTIG